MFQGNRRKRRRILIRRRIVKFPPEKNPQNTPINKDVFREIFNDIDHSMDGKISHLEFTKKYIQIHETWKLALEVSKRELENEKTRRIDLESKIYKAKNEPVNYQNRWSKDAKISLIIGQVTWNNTDYVDQQLYIKWILDEKEQKTSLRKSDDLNFNEKLTFPVVSHDSVWTWMLLSSSNENFGDLDIPLASLTENEDINPSWNFISWTNELTASLSPKWLFVTNSFDFYNKEIWKVESNIKNYEEKISKTSDVLNGISSPFRYVFEEEDTKNYLGVPSAMQMKIADQVEDLIKKGFKQEKVPWLKGMKAILMVCVFTTWITTLEKPDFIALFWYICLFITTTSQMSSVLIEQFLFFFVGVLVIILYDVVDYLMLRKIQINGIDGLVSFVGIFIFVGFIGKILLLFVLWIIKIKYHKSGRMSWDREMI